MEGNAEGGTAATRDKHGLSVLCIIFDGSGHAILLP